MTRVLVLNEEHAALFSAIVAYHYERAEFCERHDSPQSADFHAEVYALLDHIRSSAVEELLQENPKAGKEILELEGMDGVKRDPSVVCPLCDGMGAM